MYSYIKGIIVDLAKDYIVIDNNGIGYMLYVSNPYQFTKGKEYLVYVYQQVKEDGILLFGFKTKEEKELFLKLILVKGIGCKTAIGILATGDVNAIISAIESKNIAYLKRIPGIGPKAAQQIVLDLQGKFNVSASSVVLTSLEFDEAKLTDEDLMERLMKYKNGYYLLKKSAFIKMRLQLNIKEDGDDKKMKYALADHCIKVITNE